MIPIIKPVFTSLTDQKESAYNILPYEYYSIKQYQLEEHEEDLLYKTMDVVFKKRTLNFSEFVKKRLQKRDYYFVFYRKYIFPAFITKDGVLCINLGNKGKTDVSVLSSIDLYSYCLYGFILEKCFEYPEKFVNFETLISNFLFSLFVKIYRKKSGLLGFDKLLSELYYLITLYTFVNYYGYPNDDTTKKKIANMLILNINDLKLDYDFSTLEGLFKALGANNIINASVFTFYNIIANRFCIYSLPLFEDFTRFFSTLTTSSISSNSVISTNWYSVNPDVYKKTLSLLNNIISNLK